MPVLERLIEGRSSLKLLLNEPIPIARAKTTALLYCLQPGRLVLDGSAKAARVGDVVIVNRGHQFAIEPVDEGTLMLVFEMDDVLLSRAVEIDAVAFDCNSLDSTATASFGELRQMLDQVVDAMTSGDDYSSFKLFGCVYDLLDYIIKSYAERARPITDDDERLRSIIRYINGHFYEPLSLKGVAGQFHMDAAYFSKYFKKSLSVNFKDYVADVRLFHAEKALTQTDNNIANIASQNGFPNVSSFTTSFKRLYHVAPSTYRVQHNRRHSSEEAEVDVSLSETMRNFRSERGLTTGLKRNVSIDVSRHGRNIDACWLQLLNTGSLWELLNGKYKTQLISLQKLGFKYMRIWDVLEECPGCSWRLDGQVMSSDQRVNYDGVDDVFDFLVEQKMTPWIAVHLPDTTARGWSIERYRIVLSGFMNHVMERYGKAEVDAWRIEICSPARCNKSGLARALTTLRETKGVCRSVSAGTQIGGICFPYEARSNGCDVGHLMHDLAEIGCDFLSFRAFPYRIDRKNGDPVALRINDDAFPSHVCDWIGSLASDAPGKPVIISEYGFSLAPKNYLNDSLFMGSFAIRSVFAASGRVDGLGVFIASDWHGAHLRAATGTDLLSGAPGLLTKAGIPKPSGKAIRFLEDISGKSLIHWDEGYVVCDDEYSYHVVCNNYVHPNGFYYLQEEDAIRPQDIANYFGTEKTTVSIDLEGVPTGRYTVRVYSCNTSDGSVFDLWRAMGASSELTQEDVGYLQLKCMVRLDMTEEVIDGSFHMDLGMEPNEFVTVRLTCKDKKQ